MPNGLAYALLPTLAPHVKPIGFASLEALVRRVHRDRRGEALQLRDAEIRVRDHTRAVVQVLAEDQAGGRSRLIGYAWMAGRTREALQTALERAAPSASFEGAV